MQLDTTHWSGEGTFTQLLIDRLRDVPEVTGVRVENAPATRAEADYNFISNEVFVEFSTVIRREAIRRFGLLPATREAVAKAMTVQTLEQALTQMSDIGAPDYADAGMIQYLRTERIVPPYQTRGYKLVELVRLYEVGTAPRP